MQKYSMKFYNDSWQICQFILSKSRKVALLCHDVIDDDALYSIISMGLFLSKIYINWEFFHPRDISSSINLIDKKVDLNVTTEINKISNCQALIVLDTGDPKLLGSMESMSEIANNHGLSIINIDHHQTNLQFGTINIVDHTAASACEVLYNLFKSSKIKIDHNLAHSLLTGILGDTLLLKTSSTTARTLRIAATLIDLGAERMKIVEAMPMISSPDMIPVWGKLLSEIHIVGHQKNIGYIVVDSSISDLSANRDVSSRFISFIRDIKGIDVAIMFKAFADSEVKISFRSKAKYDVNSLAKSLGGGGHKNSAGCILKNMPLDEIISYVLLKTQEFLSCHR